jgi:hypothetical protein
VQHILLSRVFARELWFQVLSKVRLQNLSPGLEVAVFQEWWRQSETQLSNEQRKGFNSLVILVAWRLFFSRKRRRAAHHYIKKRKGPKWTELQHQDQTLKPSPLGGSLTGPTRPYIKRQ